MAARDHIRFLLNGQAAQAAPAATDMLLDWLRLERGLTGTKEGCAEGDCGACTVLVGRLAGDGLVYEPVNACIRPMASLDRCHVMTIEHLGDGDVLHPVQRAMVAHHGSQCGFCTPGIVMALVALGLSGAHPDRPAVETALQGNLCRCTGYAPIFRAAMEVGGDPAAEPLWTGAPEIAARLAALPADRVETAPPGASAILPADVDDLASVLVQRPEATIVAGATDVGLWITKDLRAIGPAVFIGHLAPLRRIAVADGGISVGGAATYAQTMEIMAHAFPHLGPYWARIGGAQVRAMGTIGGNIANGSPIGDTPPPLIALDASVVLRRGDTRRRLALEDVFIAYGRQDIAPGEFIETIEIPPDPPGARHAAYKISKRRDEDISSVAMALRVITEGERIVAARVALGGMAATPVRARAVEATLTGARWSAEAFDAAGATLGEDVTPLDDWRASAAYRMTVARNLMRRFWLEQSGSSPARLMPA